MSKEEEDEFVLGYLEILDTEIDGLLLIMAGLLKMMANGEIQDKMFMPKLGRAIGSMSEVECRKILKDNIVE